MPWIPCARLLLYRALRLQIIDLSRESGKNQQDPHSMSHCPITREAESKQPTQPRASEHVLLPETGAIVLDPHATAARRAAIRITAG